MLKCTFYLILYEDTKLLIFHIKLLIMRVRKRKSDKMQKKVGTFRRKSPRAFDNPGSA